MKQLVIIFFFVTLMTSTIDAQNPLYPYGVSFKSLFMDYQSQNGGSITDFSAYHHGFEVGIHKNLTENLNIVVPIKVGIVNSHDIEYENCLHKNVYGADAQIQYMFYKPNTKLVPYVMAGAGGVLESEGEFNIQIPFGAGLYFYVKDNAYINWQSAYRYSLSDNRNNLHHGIGFTYLFGNPKAMGDKTIDMGEPMDELDSDGDGLADDVDLCPQMAGLASLKGCPDRDEDGIPDYRDDCPSIAGIAIFKGCPDSDEDGIPDSDDECPNKPGVAENNGCPKGDSSIIDDMGGKNMDKDTDGDGIVDSKDNCPNESGTAANNGCPDASASSKDTDGDGIPDAQDKCPNIIGSASNMGCPQTAIADRDGDGVPDAQDKCPNSAGPSAYGGCPDSDNDGIDDSRDKCPNSPGTVATNGCPEISENDRSVLELAMRAVAFDTGKATLRTESFSVLDQISSILRKYPDYNLSIAGHTDNVGSAVNNQLLSERRAKACYEYLRDQGNISSARMNHTGYGESRPISSNDNIEGRKFNRRVAFNLVPR